MSKIQSAAGSKRKRSIACAVPKIKKRNAFVTYTYRVLKQVHPDQGISQAAMCTAETLVQEAFEKLLRASEGVLKASKRATLSWREVEYAVRLTLSGELQRHAISEAKKAVARYNDKKPRQRTTRSKRAGLQFSVARTERLMRERRIASRIGGIAAVYMAAVLEYIAAECLELSGNAAKDLKRRRIAPRHLMLGIRNDAELSLLFSGSFAHSGNMGYIHEALMKKRKIE